MKFTFGWLKDHLDTAASLGAIADRLTALGLEVDRVSDPGQALRPFTVAHVVSAAPHPNADKLRVCVVDTGNERVQVVCGAPNARTGMRGVFARVGSTLPGTGLTLAAATIRGVASQGMLCSEREMGLSDEHEGIIDLPADAPVGAPFAGVLGFDDPVVEIKLTANRGDCLGVRGVARELAAAGLGQLKPLDGSPVEGRFASPLAVRLDFVAADRAACPLFIGRYLRGVTNGPSPPWLQRRLRAIGLRPISALVDITNYVTFDLARPVHVFDADKLRGDLAVRLARPGEELAALDGRTYRLDESMCAICDDSGVVSLGGVMGGESTGCTSETKNVFVEIALFDPVRTGATGRRLGIVSDARYRFERGVDPGFAAPGMELATRLFLDLCGGAASEVFVAGAPPDWRRTLVLRPQRVSELGGIDLAAERSGELLRALGFTVRPDGANLAVEPPSWRPDVEGEPDLVEEVIRLNGYDAIPAVPLPALSAVARPAVDPAQRRGRMVRRTLAARGLVEAVTYSFIDRKAAALFGGDEAALVLSNPLSAEADTMRPSVLPGLAAAARRNNDRGVTDIALFEVGPAYADDSAAGQALNAGVLRAGMSGPRHWAQRPRPVDLYDVKADALAAAAACGINVDQVQVSADAPPWYHPGRAAVLTLGPKQRLAVFGELHPRAVAAFDLKGPVVACEVFISRLPAAKAKAARTRPPLRVSDLPAVERDFAFVVDAAVSADAVVRAAAAADKAAIARVTVFDLFAGETIGHGKKSLAIAVRLEPREKTFTDAEIEAIGRKIVAAVAQATGGVLRG